MNLGEGINSKLTEERAENRRILNLKSKRKRNLVKKAHELAIIGNLQVTLIIADVQKNVI